VIIEDIEVNEFSHRKFPTTVAISCDQAPAIPPVDTDTGVDVDNLPPATEPQTITFTIGRAPALVNGKWQFALAPAPLDALGALNFKIATCAAVPKKLDDSAPNVPPNIRVNIITGGCISDRGTTFGFDDATAPTQLINVYPFQFKGYEANRVELTCTVGLCEGANCANTVPCARSASIVERSPLIRSRSRRSIAQMFTASCLV